MADATIKAAIGLDMSDNDILKFCDDKVRILGVPELNQMRSLDEVLKPFGATILLYETKRTGPQSVEGHWCLLLKRTDKNVEFFDPYGLRVDDELDFVPDTYKAQTKQYGRLVDLIEDKSSPYTVYYNHVPMQEKGSATGTCGRWCALRAKMRAWSLLEFQTFFMNQNETSDWLATCMTLSCQM